MNLIWKAILTATVALIPFSSILNAAVLTRSGKANAVVIAPSANTELEKIALDDFVQYVARSSGATLNTVSGRAEVPTDQSVVELRVIDGNLPADPKLSRHAFLYRVSPQGLTILGADPRGLANGVHWFLRTRLGVRWYMPTELGEEVPRHPTIALETEERVIRPEFEWLRFVDGEELMWGVRHGEDALDTDFRDHWHFQKNWAFFLPATEQTVRDHPEWFAREEGQLPHTEELEELNVCVSNPDVLRTFVERAKEEFTDHPHRVMLSLEANDSPQYCRCTGCQSLKSSLGAEATQSDLFLNFCNQVAGGVKQTHSNKLFGFYAYGSYGDHTYPPRHVKPDAALAVLMTRSKYHDSVCYRHSLTDPRCQNNAAWRENFEKWTGLLDHVGVYDFWANYHWYGPEPLNRLVEDIPYWKSRGVRYVASETGYNWATMAPYYYVTARLLQDTSLKDGDLLDEFCAGMYGPASQPMRRYWQGWIDAFAGGPCRVSLSKIDQSTPYMIRHYLQAYSYAETYTPRVLRNASGALSEAKLLVRDASEKCRYRVQLADYGLQFTEHILAMLRRGDREDYAGALEAALQARAVIQEANKLPGPPAFGSVAEARVSVEIGKLQDHLATNR
jgi:hypothetical protein